MTDNTSSGLRTEADAIRAVNALVEAVRQGAANVRARLETVLAFGDSEANELLGRAGQAFVSGEDVLFLLKTERPAAVSIDDHPPLPLSPLDGTGYQHRLEQLRLGTTHNFLWHFGGRIVGGMGGTMHRSLAGLNPGSYPIAGAAQGTLSERRTITSKIYGGAVANYWVYTNPGIESGDVSERGAPVMIWLDGQNYVGLNGVLGIRMQTVTDNLVHRGLIPPMVHVLIQPAAGGSLAPASTLPGTTPESELRSIQYDTVNDDFGRHIMDEVLPEIERGGLKLRQDGYSRAMTGQSSGGIASFCVAWHRPDQLSRVYSSIGSFTALQWHPERGLDGGYIFPFKVRREPKRNIRVWLSDGSMDIDFDNSVIPQRVHLAGSWPLANLQMAQALKTRLYDFHFRFGTAAHNSAQWALDLPESLVWLWRDYNPGKTSQQFEQEEAERAKPLYRVGVVNRDAW
jgi:enterochelin esterase family protein